MAVVVKLAVKMALEGYMDYFENLRDPRTTNWPLMDSPLPTILMVASYLYIILCLGPQIMNDRKPFKLRRALIIYNGFQVLLSAYMLYEHLASGWLFDYSYSCQPVDYSRSKKAMRMANLCWWYYLSKLTEFVDTLFFVLRKKDSQVTFLHLYHHSLTPFETWICCKFIPGGHGTFGNLINNIVHVIMYFYYMMSAMGPQYQKYLWWKKYMTTIQLVQFFIVFFHSAQVLYYDCGYPKLIAVLLLIHSVIFFALFSNFYIQTYNKIPTVKVKIPPIDINNNLDNNNNETIVGDKMIQSNGQIQNGHAKNGHVPNGHVRNVCAQNGHVKNGSVKNGKIPNGIITNGLLMKTNDLVKNGVVNGLMKNGNGHIANGFYNGLVKYDDLHKKSE